jgi:hypothetical protein
MRVQHVQHLVVVVAIAALGVSVPSLWAAGGALLVCCADTDDCPDGMGCCDPALIGEDPCALERPGWCQDVCAPIGNGESAFR